MIKFDAFVFTRINFFMFNILNIELNKHAYLRNSNNFYFCFFHFYFMILLVNFVNDKIFWKNLVMNF